MFSPSYANTIVVSWLITDNKSLNNTEPNIKPKVWVETGQMHQRSDNAVDHNENAILDDNNEVGKYNKAKLYSALVLKTITYN